MGSINKVILVGNLTHDPEMKQSEGKKPVCIIGLATNRSWTDEKGTRHEVPEYHRLIAWDKLAETCHQFLRKGRKVYAEGRLQSHTYTGQDGRGAFRRRLSIVCLVARGICYSLLEKKM